MRKMVFEQSPLARPKLEYAKRGETPLFHMLRIWKIDDSMGQKESGTRTLLEDVIEADTGERWAVIEVNAKEGWAVAMRGSRRRRVAGMFEIQET